jgi:hypothetical protein
MIMTHGSIADVVSEKGTELGLESGKSWSEVLRLPRAEYGPGLAFFPLIRALTTPM